MVLIFSVFTNLIWAMTEILPKKQKNGKLVFIAVWLFIFHLVFIQSSCIMRNDNLAFVFFILLLHFAFMLVFFCRSVRNHMEIVYHRARTSDGQAQIQCFGRSKLMFSKSL